MTSKDLTIINADLITASSILYLPAEKENNNPYLANLGAYHATQAIEKSLKAIIKTDGNMNYELGHTHDLSSLFVTAASSRPELLHENEFIAENTDILSQANGLRYGTKSISFYNARGILYNAKKLFHKLEKEYMKEKGLSSDNIDTEGWSSYKANDFLELNRPDLHKNKDKAD